MDRPEYFNKCIAMVGDSLKPKIAPTCPFADYIIICANPDCGGCRIRQEADRKEEHQIVENMKDLWKQQQSGAE